MTDRANDLDPAERIRRLQERAAASRATPRQPGKRRHHAAPATRWLLGGLSVASFFTIAGTVAVASANTFPNPAPTSANTTPTPPTAARAPATRFVPAPATPRTTPAPRLIVPVPHTTTKGS